MKTLAVFAAGLLAFATAAEELRYSGTLGQSQPAGAPPLASIEMKGSAVDASGVLWSFTENGLLCRFVKSAEGRWLLDKQFKASAVPGLGPLQIAQDGKLLYPGSNGALNSFTLSNGEFKKLENLPSGAVAACVSTNEAKFKALALKDNAVFALTSGEWKELFKLPKPEKGKYCSLFQDPSTGDILAGSEYPDMQVRRFNVSGKELVNAFWPRHAIHPGVISAAGGELWALKQGAVALSSSEELKLGDEWSFKTNGVAKAPDGTWWLSTSQGLLNFNAAGVPLEKRLGGLVAPELLVAFPSGELLALDCGRFLALGVDDKADAPLRCRPDEPFRTGGGWKGKSVAAVADGEKLVALDAASKRLWSFDFKQAGHGGGSPWTPLSEENSFTKPEGLALAGGRLYVSCADGLFCKRSLASEGFEKVSGSLKGALAGSKSGLLLAFQDGALTAFDKSMNKVWTSKSGFGDVAGLAADDKYAVVTDSFSQKLNLISLKDGEIAASLESDAVPGGWEPGAVALLEPWIFAADNLNKRIVRLRITR